MAKVFRSMRPVNVGGVTRPRDVPAQGDNGPTLSLSPRDISASNLINGQIVNNTEGLSVAPNWRVLPMRFIPSRLRGRLGALKPTLGSDLNVCFSMGEGDFQTENLSPDIRLHIDTSTHGVLTCVLPNTPQVDLQQALFNSQLHWSEDEV
jgi:hypothetical protein